MAGLESAFQTNAMPNNLSIEKPDDSRGELMYIKCAECGAWLDVKPGQLHKVSHGLCPSCFSQHLLAFDNHMEQ